VEGRLQSRNWETQDGQKRSTVEIIADNIQFLRGGDKQSPASTAGKQEQAPEDVEMINLDDVAAASPDNTVQNNKKGKDSPVDNEVPF
jgi:single-strand DNA-binding protein